MMASYFQYYQGLFSVLSVTDRMVQRNELLATVCKKGATLTLAHNFAKC